MKKIEIIIIGLLVLMATALTIGSAETETTYYCYNKGEWGICTPQESILAREAMTRETSRSLSRDEMNAVLSSHEPFRDYNSDDALTPTPTLTTVPAPGPNPVLPRVWESILKNRVPSRWFSRSG